MNILLIDSQSRGFVLAGDNAIVIALAARKLPKHLQRQAIVWGALGAIAMCSLLTIAPERTGDHRRLLPRIPT